MKVKGLPGPHKTYSDSALCPHTHPHALPHLAKTSPPAVLPTSPPHGRPPNLAVSPPCVTPDLTTARLSGPHVCARPLPTPTPVAQPRTPPAASTPGCALRPAPPPRHRCLLREQRLLQLGPAVARRRPLLCPTPVLLPIKCRPLPAVKCRSTVLPGNAEAESILRGVMHAWSVAVRLLNIGVN
jgi:hypothetical protein